MNDSHTSTWRQLYWQLSVEKHVFDMDKVNVYQLTSILEELVNETDQLRTDITLLKNRVESLEGDIK
jgi:hypothetical protein